jgi:hypothetical protein
LNRTNVLFISKLREVFITEGKIDQKPPLTPDEIARFRALEKSAIVLVLMSRLDRPVGAREIADILAIDEHTAAKHLRQLSRLNLVARSGRYNGFTLLQGGRQQILGKDVSFQDPAWPISTVKKLQSAPATTSTTLIGRSEGDEEVVVGESPGTVKILQSVYEEQQPTVKKFQSVDNFPACSGEDGVMSRNRESDDVTKTLMEAGIGEPKRSSLAQLPYLTPGYVRAWEVRLKRDKRERYSTGLLVHVLECGDPQPPVNEIGHLMECRCADCKRLGYLRCPYCGRYPCACGEEGV